MALPGDKEIQNAILVFLAQNDGSASVHEIADGLANHFRLTKADLAARRHHLRREAGESVWRQKLRRARGHLVKMGALAPSAKYGTWKLP